MRLVPIALLAIGGSLLYAYYYSAGATPPAGSGGNGQPPANGPGQAPADIRPLAAAGNAQWIAVSDTAGTRHTYDQWAWYWNSIRATPLTGPQMDRILAGADRNTALLASEWWAAVQAAGLAGGNERSVWTT